MPKTAVYLSVKTQPYCVRTVERIDGAAATTRPPITYRARTGPFRGMRLRSALTHNSKCLLGRASRRPVWPASAATYGHHSEKSNETSK